MKAEVESNWVLENMFQKLRERVKENEIREKPIFERVI